MARPSTAAPFTTRNYTIAPADAWSERVEVQGFAFPVWQDAAGDSLGTAFVAASQASKTITVGLPEAAFGTPASGWSFAVVLTGQDGFSPDQARSFAATPQPFQFGVCAAGGGSPICSADPGTMPKAVDVLTPAGVSQATELDPTLGPVVIRGVPVPCAGKAAAAASAAPAASMAGCSVIRRLPARSGAPPGRACPGWPSCTTRRHTSRHRGTRARR